jgi:hypothetical protein
MEDGIMRTLLWAFCALGLGGAPVCADAPLFFCEGGACGYDEPIRAYRYRIDSGSYPIMEFRVGTNDLDALNYLDVLRPPGWHFAVQDQPMPHSHGDCTPHGEVSPGPCWCLTAGSAVWWTDDPTLAVEFFTFGYNHTWTPEDVGYDLVTRRPGDPPSWYTFHEFWDAPLGTGNGPFHGPYGPPDWLTVGPERLVHDQYGPISTGGCSVPLLIDWNADDLLDLVVGEQGDDFQGHVRVYLNEGAPGVPVYSDFFHAPTIMGPLTVPAAGPLAAHPRPVDWTGDDLFDLVVGMDDGRVMLFFNIGTAESPLFEPGVYIQVGPPIGKVDLDVGWHAAPTQADWDGDGLLDLLVGAADGQVYVCLDTGLGDLPDFEAMEPLRNADGEVVVVSSGHACPQIADVAGTGVPDLLTGDLTGHVRLYPGPRYRRGLPLFSGQAPLLVPGVEPMSRPFACHWRGDGVLDLVVGSMDGQVRLYEGFSTNIPGDLNDTGCVDQEDLGILLAAYGHGPEGDIDGDGDTDQADLGILLTYWGAGCA